MPRPETLNEIGADIDRLRVILCTEEDSETVRSALREYLRLNMVRYALKVQKEMTGNTDVGKAYIVANAHIAQIELKEVHNGRPIP